MIEDGDEKYKEVQELIKKAREERYIGSPTEARYWSKKLQFYWVWFAGHERHEANFTRAKAEGFEWHAYHIETGILNGNGKSKLAK